LYESLFRRRTDGLFVEPHGLEVAAFEARQLSGDQKMLVRVGVRAAVREFAERSDSSFQLVAQHALFRRRRSTDHGRECEGVIEGEGPGLDVAPRRPKYRLCFFNCCKRTYRIAHQILELELKCPIAALHDRYGGLQHGCCVSDGQLLVRWIGRQRRDEALGRANRIDLAGIYPFSRTKVRAFAVSGQIKSSGSPRASKFMIRYVAQ